MIGFRNQQVFRRFLLSGVVLLASAGALGIIVWLQPWPQAEYFCYWLHDWVWLPLVGYLFYWGAPWSQIIIFASGLLLFNAWLAWVLGLPPLQLPVIACAWVYFRQLQPAGGLMLAIRRWEIRWLRGWSWSKGEGHQGGIVIPVVETLARAEEEKFRRIQAVDDSPKGDRAHASLLRERICNRFCFLSDYLVPFPERPELFSAWQLASAGEALARAIPYGEEGKEELGQRFHQVAQAYFRKLLPSTSPQQDLAMEVLEGPARGFPEGFRRSVALLELLARYDREAGRIEDFLASDSVIRQALREVWELSRALEGFRSGRGPREYEIEAVRRIGHRLTAHGHFDRLHLGAVLERWLEVLFSRGEFECVAQFGRVAMELADSKLEASLEAARRLPGPPEQNQILMDFLSQNRLARPEAILHLSARAWLAVLERLKEGPAMDYARSRALQSLFERGDAEWILAIERRGAVGSPN